MTAVDHAELKLLAEDCARKADKLGCDEWRAPELLKRAASGLAALLSEIGGLKAKRDHPTLSWKSRDPLPPSILANALSQIAAEGVIDVGERHIHADNLIAMAVDYLRPQAPDSWRPDREAVARVLKAWCEGGLLQDYASVADAILDLRPQTAESV